MNIDKDIKRLEGKVKKCKTCASYYCNQCEISYTEIKSIENVLWALNGKDCVIETQTHNEEVLEEYVAKLEVELETYKKIAENWAEHIDFCPNNFEITKCEDYDNNCAKCRLEYARKEVEK